MSAHYRISIAPFAAAETDVRDRFALSEACRRYATSCGIDMTGASVWVEPESGLFEAFRAGEEVASGLVELVGGASRG